MLKETMTREVTCRFCKKTSKIVVDVDGYYAWQYGNMHIQDALPELSPGQRELLISGICGPCFDNLFKE